MSIWKAVIVYGMLMGGGFMFLVVTSLFFIADKYPQLFDAQYHLSSTSHTSIIFNNWYKYVPLCMLTGAISGFILFFATKYQIIRKN
jgi:hypothetical protein